jgi:CheY-like chemotaxis protein
MPLLALVVDDSMLVRHTVGRFLQERGFEVETAGNGVEALEILARVRPDLIITDLRMPKMHGGELITKLKSKPETARIPVLILAARQSGRDHNHARDEYTIYKDIDVNAQLDRALKLVLGEVPGKNSPSR